MVPYVVKQGDYLVAIATRFGFEAMKVWRSGENDELRARRPNPNMLHPGDILHIPEKQEGISRVKAGSANTFTADVPTVKVSVLICRRGKPCPGEAFEVVGHPALNGSTDGDGKLTLAVPATCRELTVMFPAAREMRRLQVGHLDPIEETSGLVTRLVQLHVMPVPPPDATREDLEALLAVALRRFQASKGMAVTGTADAATLQAIVAAHKS